MRGVLNAVADGVLGVCDLLTVHLCVCVCVSVRARARGEPRCHALFLTPSHPLPTHPAFSCLYAQNRQRWPLTERSRM